MADPTLPRPSVPDPDLRAADSDRQAVAAALGRHLSDGRLTVEEYDERLARAYAARTYGELGVLLADLPAGTAARPAAGPAAPAPAYRSAGCAAHRGTARSAWASWAATAVLVTTIWLVTTVTTGVHPFWPIWVIGPWGAVLLARTLSGAPHPSGGRRRG
jgi:hypothetical protein